MIDRKRVTELAKLAGFEFSHEGDDYMCFDYKEELTNPYRIVFNFNPILSNKIETEEDVIAKLFEELARIGRMQVRQQLVKIINIFNTD
jgi:hypothetical protein